MLRIYGGRKYFRRVAVVGYGLRCIRKFKSRISIQVSLGYNLVIHVIGITHKQMISPLIERVSKLCMT